MKQRFFAVAMIFLVLMSVVFGVITVMAPEQAEAQYSVACYREQGGAKAVAGSGCEYEYQSGSTLDIQSGTTVNMAGNFSSDGGAITYTDNVFIDGQADVVQLTIQGYTTQTNNLLVLENSSGTDKFVVDGSGNVTTMGDFDEAVVVDGEADEVQLTVSGYTTQTSALLVLENSSGTDKFVVDGSGNVTTMGDFDEAVVVDGEADEVQLTVSGYTTQTSNVVEVENSSGTAKATIDNNGKGTFAGGVQLSGDGSGFLIVGAQTAISATDAGVITPTGTYQQLESAAEVTPTVTTTDITTGTVLVLINTSNTTINLADSGTMMLTAAAALGQYDSLTLWFDGTNWIEISRANN